LLLSLMTVLLLVVACGVRAQVEGAWGKVTLVRGRLEVQAGRPLPVSRYRSEFTVNRIRFDPMVDYHVYRAAPATPTEPARGAWWFVRFPLWIPVLALSVPTLVYWFMLVRSRPAWQCRGCGYDLRGVKGEACPECGRGAVV
jgi:hypothetical protein